MEKLISVVIPVYNRADIIKDTIESVFAQTYQNFEIIIVDDGSIDDIAEVVKQFCNPKIKYIRQKNSGVSKARNTGINNSTGEYIAFLDSDDLWHKQKLEKQIAVIEKNPDMGMVTCSSQYITFQNEEITVKSSCAKTQEENIKAILLNPDSVFTGTPTLFIRKNIFEKTGFFDEELAFCEDWDLFFRISLCYEICNIDEVLTYVRCHKESLSKAAPVERFMESYLRFLDKAFANKILPHEVCKIKNQAYSNAMWNIGSWALYKSRNLKCARKSLFASLKYSYTKLSNIKFLTALILSYLPPIFLTGYERLKTNCKKHKGKK